MAEFVEITGSRPGALIRPDWGVRINKETAEVVVWGCNVTVDQCRGKAMMSTLEILDCVVHASKSYLEALACDISATKSFIRGPVDSEGKAELAEDDPQGLP